MRLSRLCRALREDGKGRRRAHRRRRACLHIETPRNIRVAAAAAPRPAPRKIRVPATIADFPARRSRPPQAEARAAKAKHAEVDDRVCFLTKDKAPQVSASADKLTLTGSTAGGGGYRMARANRGAKAGAWSARPRGEVSESDTRDADSDESRRRRGRDADSSLINRGGAPAATRIVLRRIAAAPRPRRG